jgi:hypothetical protein
LPATARPAGPLPVYPPPRKKRFMRLADRVAGIRHLLVACKLFAGGRIDRFYRHRSSLRVVAQGTSPAPISAHVCVHDAQPNAVNCWTKSADG